jgi:hypothetical protein
MEISSPPAHRLPKPSTAARLGMRRELAEARAALAVLGSRDRVLECAVAANAAYIVSGDRRHLLPLGAFRGIAIVSAADFLALVPKL